MTWKKPFLLPLLVLGVVLMRCGGSGSNAEGDQQDANDSTVAGAPFIRPLEHDTSLIIAHAIQGFAPWKKAFDLAQPIREKYGIQTLHVYRGTIDTNMTMVFTTVQNTQRAREYITSPDLEDAMDTAGVAGDINAYWLHQTLRYTKPITDTVLMFMSFKVMSYDRWENAFLDDYREQPDRDFQVLSVLRGIDEPGMVYMFFAVNDPGYVEKMEKNNAFRMKMLASGVVSYPVTYRLSEVPI